MTPNAKQKAKEITDEISQFSNAEAKTNTLIALLASEFESYEVKIKELEDLNYELGCGREPLEEARMVIKELEAQLETSNKVRAELQKELNQSGSGRGEWHVAHSCTPKQQYHALESQLEEALKALAELLHIIHEENNKYIIKWWPGIDFVKKAKATLQSIRKGRE